MDGVRHTDQLRPTGNSVHGFGIRGLAGETFLDRILPAMPAKRLASPEEISSAVCWLRARAKLEPTPE